MFGYKWIIESNSIDNVVFFEKLWDTKEYAPPSVLNKKAANTFFVYAEIAREVLEMNYVWITYEKGLHYLLQHLPQNHTEYDKVCTLQTLLQRNISQAEALGDTEVLCLERKQIVADLEDITRRAIENSFVSLCITACLLFHYVAHVYKITFYTRTVFSGDRIWSRQCQCIVEDFRKRPAVAEVVKGVVESTRVALYHLDARVAELIRLIEEYERTSRLLSKRLANRQDEIIRQADLLTVEVLTIDNKSFHELIEWCLASLAELDTSADNVQVKTSVELEPLPLEPIQQSKRSSEEAVYQEMYQDRSEKSQKEEIGQSTLRETIVRAFSLSDLRSLCTDITDSWHRNGINELVNLDLLEGDELREKTESLVEFVVKRELFSYLIEAVCRARPRLELCKNHMPPQEKRKKII